MVWCSPLGLGDGWMDGEWMGGWGGWLDEMGWAGRVRAFWLPDGRTRDPRPKLCSAF